VGEELDSQYTPQKKISFIEIANKYAGFSKCVTQSGYLDVDGVMAR